MYGTGKGSPHQPLLDGARRRARTCHATATANFCHEDEANGSSQHASS